MNSRDLESSNEISSEDFAEKNYQRSKRQTDYSDMQGEMNEEGPAGDVQNIWNGMVQTLVDGGKQILKKVVESFDKDSEQPEEYSETM